uniref:Ig-like domain-containing protein n=1 Tax=Gopherus evgoodei TaxID=1825980 RepID=A0A8C4Y8H5_9SAUR
MGTGKSCFCGWQAGFSAFLCQRGGSYLWIVILLRNVFFPPEQPSNPEFGSLQKSLEVGIGQNVTLSCRSTSGSLPINYTFFRGSQNLWPTILKTERNPALFNLTINSASDLGEYKCKVVNGISNSAKYSESLNFTLLGRSLSVLLFVGLSFKSHVCLVLIFVFHWLLYRSSVQTSAEHDYFPSKDRPECDTVLSLRKRLFSHQLCFF